MLANKMRELRARRAAGETGFTLVELLVVVVIIVALAAIAVPIFLNQKDKADAGVAQSDATAAGKILATAVSTGTAVDITTTSVSTDADSPMGSQIANTSGTFTVYDDTVPVTAPGTLAAPSSADCVEVDIDGVTAAYSVTGGLLAECP